MRERRRVRQRVAQLRAFVRRAGLQRGRLRERGRRPVARDDPEWLRAAAQFPELFRRSQSAKEVQNASFRFRFRRRWQPRVVQRTTLQQFLRRARSDRLPREVSHLPVASAGIRIQSTRAAKLTPRFQPKLRSCVFRSHSTAPAGTYTHAPVDHVAALLQQRRRVQLITRLPDFALPELPSALLLLVWRGRRRYRVRAR